MVPPIITTGDLNAINLATSALVEALLDVLMTKRIIDADDKTRIIDAALECLPLPKDLHPTDRNLLAGARERLEVLR